MRHIDVFHTGYLVAQNDVVVRIADIDNTFHNFDKYGKACSKYKCLTLHGNSGVQS